MKPGKTLARYTIILLILSYAFVFYGLGNYSLKEPDEGRYAEIPREMVQSGDFIVPRLNDVRYFEKPPFLYWSVAASYKLFGISEWSFRFPNALAAVLCVFSLFFFLRRWVDEKAAFLASLVLVSSLGFFAMARIVTTDMILTFWLFLSLLCFYGHYRERKGTFLYGFYTAMALATLTKGPVAPVLLCATIFLFLLTERNISFVRQMKPVRGLLLYLLIAAPWFIIISLREKEFFDFFFVDQHFLRFISTKHKRGGPVYYFIPVLLGGMLPWSFFIPRAVLLTWKRPDCRLFLLWSAIVFAFFSLSGSKLPPYILPLFPTVSVVVGALFHDRAGSPFRKPWEIIACGLFMTILALSCLVYFSPSFMAYIADVSMDAPGITGDLRHFSLWISFTASVCLVLLFFRRFRLPGALFVLLFLFSLSTVIAIMAQSGVIDRVNTVKKLAAAAREADPPPDIIVNYSALDLTLPFYLGKPVMIASYKGELAMGSKYEDARKIFMEEEEFFRLIGSERKVLFVTKLKRIDNLEKRFPGRIRTRICQNDRCLLSNY